MATLECRLHLTIENDLLQKAQQIARKQNSTVSKLIRRWIEATEVVQLELYTEASRSKIVSFNLQISQKTNQKLEQLSKHLNLGKNSIIKLIIQHHARTKVTNSVSYINPIEHIKNGDTLSASNSTYDNEMNSIEILSLLFANLFHEKIIPADITIKEVVKDQKAFSADRVELIHLIKGIQHQQNLKLKSSSAYLQTAYSIGKVNKSLFYSYTQYYIGIQTLLKSDLLKAQDIFLNIFQKYPKDEYLFERALFLYRICKTYIEGNIELGDMIYKYNDCSIKLQLLQSEFEDIEEDQPTFLFGTQTYRILQHIEQTITQHSGNHFDNEITLNPFISLHAHIYKLLNKHIKDYEEEDYRRIILHLQELKSEGFLPDIIDYYIGYLLFAYGDRKEEQYGQSILLNIARYSKIRLIGNKAVLAVKEKHLFFV